MSIIYPLLRLVHKEFTHAAPKWSIVHSTDISFLEKECNTPSEFDPYHTRKNMMQRYKSGQSAIKTMRCEYGQVTVIYYDNTQYNDIPWELWGRILRLYTDSFSKNKIKFKIFFLASPHLRTFPDGEITPYNINGPHTMYKPHKPIGPHNINGGYTYPCNHETIIIYRAEDATRVLIHELMHSCCLDNMALGIDQVEAETEAWAELIYIALLSRGTAMFYTLLQKQSAWIINQNEKVVRHITTPKQFPWRYTIGKEEVWRRWNILKHASIDVGNSLRLTCPPTNSIKQSFGVTTKSTIL